MSEEGRESARRSVANEPSGRLRWRNPDAVAGIGVVVLAVLAVVAAGRFPEAGGAVPGPATFPLGMAVGWGVAGVALIWAGGRRGPVAAGDPAPPGWRPWGLLGLAVGYAATMTWLGFISSSALFVALAMRALGYGHGWRAAALALAAAFLVYWIFGVVMGVPLPEGGIG